MWSNLVRESAQRRRVSEDEVTHADALEDWLMGLTESKFDAVKEQIEHPVSAVDGMTSEEWVGEWDREQKIRQMMNRR